MQNRQKTMQNDQSAGQNDQQARQNSQGAEQKNHSDEKGLFAPDGRVIEVADVSRLAVKAGDCHCVTDLDECSQPLLEGQFDIQDCCDDVLVHATDAIAASSATASIDLPNGVVFGLLLAGELSFALNGNSQQLNSDQPMAFLFNIKAGAKLDRHIHQGAYTRKVTVTVTRPWFERHVLQGCSQWRRFFESDGEMLIWPAGEQLADCGKLLQRLVAQQQKGESAALGRFCLQASAIQCFTQALMGAPSHSLSCSHSLSQTANITSSQKASNNQKINNKKQQALMEQVDDILSAEADLSGKVGVQDIASQIGMSVSALQRSFKGIYGGSVASYIRRKRLERARRALEEGASIGEVAFQAGYRHSSNFTSAFKKAFGCSPGDWVAD